MEGLAFEVRSKMADASRSRCDGEVGRLGAREMAVKDGGVRRGMLGVSERVRKWRAQAIFAAMEGPGRGVQGRVQK